MLQALLAPVRTAVRKNLFLRRLIGYYFTSSGLFDNYFRNYKLTAEWISRLNDIVASDDNALIERVKNAGVVSGGKQTMHNGIKIHLGSYYGPETVVILNRNKGVHEPQEERVFAEILRHIPENATMIEMGAFWSFYSMWFNKEVKGARNYMVEPDIFNLGQGERNFRLNKMKGTFIHGFIGEKNDELNGVKVYAVDEIIEEHKISHVHILHSDIQGYEYEMLKGARKSLEAGKIDYVFISTHTNEIHNRCRQFLDEINFRILAAANMDETFSVDGLIVAAAPHIGQPAPIKISLKGKA